MRPLKGYQRRYLRAHAHNLKPVVFVGRSGLTPTVLLSAEKALRAHELIKIKYIDFKEKDRKKAIAEDFERQTCSAFVGMIGHTALFYRCREDPADQKIVLPERTT